MDYAQIVVMDFVASCSVYYLLFSYFSQTYMAYAEELCGESRNGYAVRGYFFRAVAALLTILASMALYTFWGRSYSVVLAGNGIGIFVSTIEHEKRAKAYYERTKKRYETIQTKRGKWKGKRFRNYQSAIGLCFLIGYGSIFLAGIVRQFLV